MTTAGKPLIVSVAGHVILVGALVWLVGRAPPLQLPQLVPQNSVEVAFTLPQPAPPPKPVVHRPPVKPPVDRRVVEEPQRPPEPRYAPPMQTAALPPMPAPAPPPVAAPAPTISAGYRAELSAWLESHKRYPDSARERGEQGRVVLRFHVARSGRVLDYAVAGSSGYPDLDAAVDAMMRGATLPPFPADMAAPEIEVSVTVRFALTR